MTASDEITQRLAAAQQSAQTLGLSVPDTEAEIIDLMATFEARMQGHFKRGPFFKKLRALLVAAGDQALGDRIHHYALAVNVLKHGTGASYRDLKSARALPFKLHVPAGNIRLVDVKEGGFYAGLVDALTEAYQILQNR